MVLYLVIMMFVIYLIPSEEIDNNSSNLVSYKLIHCDVHSWVNKPTGFDGKEFESNYTLCSKCGFNPETQKYE